MRRFEGNRNVSLETPYGEDWTGNIAVVDNATGKAIAQVPFADIKALVALWVRRQRGEMDDDTILLGFPPSSSPDDETDE